MIGVSVSNGTIDARISAEFSVCLITSLKRPSLIQQLTVLIRLLVGYNECVISFSIGTYENTQMTKLFHPLLALITSSTDKELARYIEFLKEENKILRSRVPGKQIHTTRAEEETLLVPIHCCRTH